MLATDAMRTNNTNQWMMTFCQLKVATTTIESISRVLITSEHKQTRIRIQLVILLSRVLVKSSNKPPPPLPQQQQQQQQLCVWWMHAWFHADVSSKSPDRRTSRCRYYDNWTSSDIVSSCARLIPAQRAPSTVPNRPWDTVIPRRP